MLLVGKMSENRSNLSASQVIQITVKGGEKISAETLRFSLCSTSGNLLANKVSRAPKSPSAPKATLATPVISLQRERSRRISGIVPHRDSSDFPNDHSQSRMCASAIRAPKRFRPRGIDSTVLTHILRTNKRRKSTQRATAAQTTVEITRQVEAKSAARAAKIRYCTGGARARTRARAREQRSHFATKRPARNPSSGLSGLAQNSGKIHLLSRD